MAKRQKTAVSSIFYILLSALLGAIGQIFYKYASNNLHDVSSFLLNPFLYIGIGFYGIGLIFMLKALRRGELTVIYPIMATSFIWVCFMSPFFFSTDSMNPMKWVGIAIIVLGVSLVGIGGRK